MAAGCAATAIARFLRAKGAFQAAHLLVPAAMARGYAAVAEKALPESHGRSAESLIAILDSPRGMESLEAQFFADQLLTADRIFASGRLRDR